MEKQFVLSKKRVLIANDAANELLVEHIRTFKNIDYWRMLNVVYDNNNDPLEKDVYNGRNLKAVILDLVDKYKITKTEAMSWIAYSILLGHVRITDSHIIKDIDYKGAFLFLQHASNNQIDIDMEKDEIFVDLYSTCEYEPLRKLLNINICAVNIQNFMAGIMANEVMIYVDFTEKGQRHYSASLLKTLEHTLEAEDRIQEVEKRIKIVARKTISFERNIMVYMSMFVAVLAFIGVNFIGIANSLINTSVRNLIVLNASLVITITMIFIMVDLSSGLNINAGLDGKKEKKFYWGKVILYASIVIFEVTITAILYHYFIV